MLNSGILDMVPTDVDGAANLAIEARLVALSGHDVDAYASVACACMAAGMLAAAVLKLHGFRVTVKGVTRSLCASIAARECDHRCEVTHELLKKRHSVESGRSNPPRYFQDIDQTSDLLDPLVRLASDLLEEMGFDASAV